MKRETSADTLSFKSKPIEISSFFKTIEFKSYSTEPFQTTVESMVELRLRRQFLPRKEVSDAFYASTSQAQKPIKYRLYFESDKSDKKENLKPWIFLVPGIFSEERAPLATHIISQLNRLGFNVAMVPNPFSAKFSQSIPKELPGNIGFEAKIHCDVLKKLREQKNISKPIPMIGVSYGGLLSAAVFNSCNVYFSNLLILNPAIDLKSSMRKLSQGLQQLLDHPERHSLLTGSPFKLLLKAKFNDQKIYEYLFLRDFYEKMSASLKRALKNKAHHKGGLKSLKKWKESFDFKILENKIYGNLLREGEEGSIFHWLKKIPSNKDYFILQTDDDPINFKKDSLKLKEFSSENIWVLKGGGHLGYVDDPWFSKFLEFYYRHEASP